MVAEMKARPDDLLTYEEAAQELGKSPETIKGAVSKGILSTVKLPRDRRRYIRRADVEYFRDKPFIKSLSRVQPTPEQQEAPTPIAEGTTQPEESPAESDRLMLELVRSLADGFTGIAAGTSANLAATYRALFAHLPPELSHELAGKLPEIMQQSMAATLAAIGPVVQEYAAHGAVSEASVNRVAPTFLQETSKVGPALDGEAEYANHVGAMVKRAITNAGVPIVTQVGSQK